ncbi:UDP-2,3-diacylglucosamine hydrolase [Sulfurimicrobium lacus]|uniref:UDP-2,3-diacylglucosamine hydrolase n=1 Tax=Sulfurimicrobium lacus TaxID=2715678 RepID=A0A6F8VG78_9PROT|nr:UDP-2,3-diacylglucosamine diphosphatase [Sulfurimicrobium lacus]BCB28026.1 UDP-2,3-diacylglucosamine hydrolase [Sulfurimicrobium lacus]
MAHSLFISDLHLSADRPEVLSAFSEFLATTAVHADALYILGDLFEYWAGDDDLDAPFNRQVVAALAALNAGGTALYLMHGNRDFLMGEALATACGAHFLHDPELRDIHGTATLLMHGDKLCTDDTAYLAFREQVRDAQWQQAFLAQPLALRKAQIEQLREQSRQAQREKAAEIMDVNAESVINLLGKYGYPRLIHGHTHRPALHLQEIDGRRCERWVLPDWYEQGGYLRCDEHGCAAINIQMVKGEQK